jgi:hypothetical protein
MLKKVVHIALVLLLTAATTGFTISKLYCGNHLVAISIFKPVKCNCGDKDCHTNIKQIKVTDNYSVSEVVHSGIPTSFDLPSVSSIALVTFTHPALAATFFSIKAPPFSSKNPIALLQSFRI